MESKEKNNIFCIEKIKFIDIKTKIENIPVNYPSDHCLNGSYACNNINILENGNILFINELIYSTDDSFGSDFDVSSVEIYDKDFNKLICKKEFSKYCDLSILKNNLIYILNFNENNLFDISQNKFNEIKDENIKSKLREINLLKLSNTKMNYFSKDYDYQNRKHIIRILDDKFNQINLIDIGENIYHINNIYEIPNINLIIITALKKKIIFYNTIEKKIISSFNTNFENNNIDFVFNYYDNVIKKNNKLYVGLNHKILIFDLKTLKINTIITFNEVNFFYCFYNLDKNNILVAGDQNIYLINTRKQFISLIFNGIDGKPIRFEKINQNSFRLITSDGIIIYKVNKNNKK